MLPPPIDAAFAHDGPLGVEYERTGSWFRVWAPTATAVDLLLVRGVEESHAMTVDGTGTWSVHIDGDLHRLPYRFRAVVDGVAREAIDPYGRASTINAGRSVVVDPERSVPAHWTGERPPFSGQAVDAIIYELHTRDFSISPDSGISRRHRGKWLGLTEHGTRTPSGNRSGIDVIRELGVTHVQLLPVYDFGSVDETDHEHYNWGYDPVQYNVPEGSYATNPADPVCRLVELKTAIQSLHDDGLRVIMDVVYNHVYDARAHAFEHLVPGYFFRMHDDGSYGDASACGNEVASERGMVRRYIVDSVTYWAREFHFDGFRFDLMGILDVETMRQVRAALDAIDSTILVIGEGWSMGELLPPHERADQQNAARLPRIGHFNDGLRDAVKGSVFEAVEAGWAQGDLSKRDGVLDGIVGNVRYSETIGGSWGEIEPGQSVAYVEAHDNLTLADKLAASMADAGPDQRARAFRVATSIALLAQGLPFLHAGQEFMRSKGGDDNSFRSGDEVNALRWEQRIEQFDMVEYVRGLIALRRAHPAFRLRTADAVRDSLHFLPSSPDVVAYALDGLRARDTWAEIVVIHHVGHEVTRVDLPARALWGVAVDEWRSGFTVPLRAPAASVDVGPLSTMVLYR